MLKTNKRALLKALGALALVAGMSAGPAWAQTPIVLKMAHVYNPGNIWFETAEAYAKAVETKSGGKVKIQIAASGSTGDWPASIEGLKIGQTISCSSRLVRLTATTRCPVLRPIHT